MLFKHRTIGRSDQEGLLAKKGKLIIVIALKVDISKASD